MGHLEISSHNFALRSGVRLDNSSNDGNGESNSFATCVQPQEATQRRKGALALLMEPAGDHPALAEEACRIAQAAITQQYYADTSLSLTSSLLAALDRANMAVLEHDYAQKGLTPTGTEGIAVQAGGVRLKGAKVGVTAALFRPDGTGVYLAQLAPTQAYIVHNGAVQALPEPPGWSDEGDLFDLDEEDGANARPKTPIPLPAQSLGSQPGIVVDLIYRRIEGGDIVAFVSPGLARHLDRATAEGLFLHKDAASVNEALYEIAQQHGMARAQALVMGVGIAGGRSEFSDYHALGGEAVSANGGSRIAPLGALNALKQKLPSINLGAARQKEPVWQGQEQVEQTYSPMPEEPYEEPAEPVILHKPSTPTPDYNIQAVADDVASADTAEAEETDSFSNPKVPTTTLVYPSHAPLDLPPYKQPTPLFAEGMKVEEGEETVFNGWEDLPPALGAPKYPVLQRVSPVTSEGQGEAEARPYLHGLQSDSAVYPQPRVYNIQRPPAPPSPYIEFGHDIDEAIDDPAPTLHIERASHAYGEQSTPIATRPRINLPKKLPQISRPRMKIKVSPQHVQKGKAVLEVGARWSASALKNLLPERTVPEGDRRTRMGRQAGGQGQTIVPRRTVIAAALVLVFGVLLFSVFSGAGSKKQAATVNYLQEAKQEDLLANQPGVTDAQRQVHLLAALDKAQKALQVDPQSVEAKRLLTKVQAALDKAEGVTRLKESKLLFDLGKVAAASSFTTTVGATSPAGITLSDMVLQSDDAYLFDKGAGRIYRCKLAAQTCAPVLSSGDSVSGEKVGTLAAMTMRVGSLVALDERLVAYIYNADTSAWQAQPLGDAASLQQPRDVATYDGNLYLLGAKPGQVSKYASGAYGSAPTDWIQDPASLEQMKDPVAIGIDGVIYVLLADGKVLAMQGGKVVKTITPTGGGTSPATGLLTGTDISDLYVLRADGTLTRLGKEGQTLGAYKPTLPDAGPLTGVAVDEGKGKVYLLKGQHVYETTLPARAVQVPSDGAAQQPVAKPTVEP